MYDGEIVYEIAYAREGGKSAASPIAVVMRLIPAGSLKWSFGRCWQIVPENVREQGSARQVIPLKKERLVRFRMPRSRQRCLAQARKWLPLLKQSQNSWMYRRSIGHLDESFESVNRGYKIALAKVTAAVGWDARGLFQDHSMDFHWMARTLRWKRFCIEVRDQIIATLADAYAKIGAEFGQHPRLVVRNLPTLNDVEAAEAALASGPTRFDDLLKPFQLEL